MPKKGKQYKCSACKNQPPPPSPVNDVAGFMGTQLWRIYLFFNIPLPRQLAGQSTGYIMDTLVVVRVLTTQGSQMPITARHREISDFTTLPAEKSNNLGKGHSRVDVVLQELREISSRLSHVENSIDSYSNTRTSTPHRPRPLHSPAAQGFNETPGISVPVSSSSVGCALHQFHLDPRWPVLVAITLHPLGLGMFHQVDRLVPQSLYHSYPIYASVVCTAKLQQNPRAMVHSGSDNQMQKGHRQWSPL